MNPSEKEDMLQFFGEIGGHLLDDQGLLEHKVLQTQSDIERLKGKAGALRLKKAAVFVKDEGDEAVQAIDAIGVCVTHLSAAIAHQEHKRDALQMACRTVRAANQELNEFVNALHTIPNLD